MGSQPGLWEGRPDRLLPKLRQAGEASAVVQVRRLVDVQRMAVRRAFAVEADLVLEVVARLLAAAVELVDADDEAQRLRQRPGEMAVFSGVG